MTRAKTPKSYKECPAGRPGQTDLSAMQQLGRLGQGHLCTDVPGVAAAPQGLTRSLTPGLKTKPLALAPDPRPITLHHAQDPPLLTSSGQTSPGYCLDLVS